jgi:hypothetical protein
MVPWQRDKQWSDRFINEIKACLGVCLIGEATEEEDQKQNTDLVLRVNSLRVGCRIRKPLDNNGESTYLKYFDQFTIRSVRQSGMKTELEKILGGWGDYFFYGFSDLDERLLEAFTLCDLGVFRGLQKDGNLPKSIHKANREAGGSQFEVWRWIDFPGQFILYQTPGLSKMISTSRGAAS